MALTVGQPVSDHTLQAYLRGEPTPIVFELSSHRGSWVVLFFYPGDFTFVCPTELAAFAKRHSDFLREDAVLLAASTNSCFSHKAWFETDPRLADVRYPVIADTLQDLSRSFGVLLEDGATHRGTFIIDPNGVLLHMSVTEHDVGRSVDEVLRVLRAFRTGRSARSTGRQAMRPSLPRTTGLQRCSPTSSARSSTRSRSKPKGCHSPPVK